jgi:glycosyltransferase involved in cell wall biosynthesis
LSRLVQEALADPRPFLLFLGRISWKKGLDRLVRALAGVEGVRLIVAGNDDEGYWPRIAALVEDLGLGARVSAVGVVRGADKERLFAAAQALVLPSYSENFGNVVLEAMAAGCPVVVTPEVGAAEIVEREGAGAVVSGEPGRLGPALGALLRDRERRELMSTRGKAAAAALSWEQLAPRMAELYRSLSADEGRP